jgi:hypothetical protein
MDDPALDLVMLKKICVELQRELAFSSPDIEAVVKLADSARYLADCIGVWARKQ